MACSPSCAFPSTVTAHDKREATCAGARVGVGSVQVFLRLGVTSFGGPIAHLGYFRTEIVERRRWMDDRAYADLVALCQFLPGPASSQVGFGIGLHRAGYRGALAAFIAFTLPSAALMLAFASGAALFTGTIGEGILAGLKIVAVAIVAQAVLGMAKTLTPDRQRARSQPSQPSPRCCWPDRSAKSWRSSSAGSPDTSSAAHPPRTRRQRCGSR